MSYELLDHATDAFIKVTAPTLEETFLVSGNSVVETIIDRDLVEEQEEKTLHVSGKDLSYLLFNWLEEVIYQTITEGFAIHRFSVEIIKNPELELNAIAYGEKINLQKHKYKVEIKAPTFHLMEINQNGSVTMQFLLDL